MLATIQNSLNIVDLYKLIFIRCTLLTCTTKGNGSIKTIDLSDTLEDSGASKKWNVCGSGSISCSQVDGSENYALFGGWVCLGCMSLHISFRLADRVSSCSTGLLLVW